MKNIFKYFALLSAVAFAFVSCQQDNLLFIPDNECLTFSTDKGNYLLSEEPEITVDLVRGVISDAITVELQLEGDTDVLSLASPSPVSFAAGESTATVKIAYDMDKVEPGTNYSVTVSFDKTKASPTAFTSFTANVVLPGGPSSEYEDYATVEAYQGKINSCINLYAEKYSTLQVSRYDKTKYRIRNALNSGVDLDFTLGSDGIVYLSNETTLCPYDNEQYIMIRSTIEYEGEYITFWIDPNPKYNKVAENIGTGEYAMDMTNNGGTSITWYVWMETASKGILKFSADDDGWWRMYYDVVDKSPRPDPDAEFTKRAKVEFYQGKINDCVTSDKELHSTLLVNLYDNTKYRIKNAMNSDIDLDFTLGSDGIVYLTNETTLCPYDNEQYIKIPSSIKYEGEPITFWIDPNPKYNKVAENIGTGDYAMDMTPNGGTSITWYVWMETASKGILKFSADDDGWWRMYYDVVEVY
ncbi:MAG: hypothetical protein J5495_02315 [Bacteroidales bacterium]|nr:hypothetical protein [Bacteroidales bacterium]